jgi:hypothetical protein
MQRGVDGMCAAPRRDGVASADRLPLPCEGMDHECVGLGARVRDAGVTLPCEGVDARASAPARCTQTR